MLKAYSLHGKFYKAYISINCIKSSKSKTVSLGKAVANILLFEFWIDFSREDSMTSLFQIRHFSKYSGFQNQ